MRIRAGSGPGARVPAGTAMTRFVSVDSHKPASGPGLRDLFAAADDIATRWKSAEAVLEIDWSAEARYGRICPGPFEPTDADIARFRTRHDEIARLDEEE